jgi:hypothetical protein
MMTELWSRSEKCRAVFIPCFFGRRDLSLISYTARIRITDL